MTWLDRGIRGDRTMTMIATRETNGPKSSMERFIHSEVAGSIVLLASTAIALAWANSPWAGAYFHLLHTTVGVTWGGTSFFLPLHGWINDGLMAVFFFVVGLEIKRELAVGELSTFAKAALPVAAAAGGMIAPALIFLAFNGGGPGVHGWGIPMATDIAFALGVLAMAGSRVPAGLKIFLAALAIADDLGAVAVIAVFYTDKIEPRALLAAVGLLVLLLFVVRAGVKRRGVLYALVACVWLAVFASGIHSTVAGILLALIVPVRPKTEPREFIEATRERLGRVDAANLSVDALFKHREQLEFLDHIRSGAAQALPPGVVLEHSLHPIQVWFILPLFALANAGVVLGDGAMRMLGSPVPLGIILGLVIGKPLGIIVMSWIAVKSGRGALPDGVTWMHLLAAACLGGIGFTMSLFITDLAFADEALAAAAKVGILVGSIAAGLAGFALLKVALARSSDVG